MKMRDVLLTGLAAGALTVTGMGCQQTGTGAGADTIHKGSTVKFHYTLTVDGAERDSSSGKDPLTYVQGSGQIIPGLEEQMLGLHQGDKKKAAVSPEKGYGRYDQKAFQTVPKEAFPDIKNLKVGDFVRGQHGGREVQAVVKTIGDKDVTLDFNHPLAGKTLNFDIEVVNIGPQKESRPP